MLTNVKTFSRTMAAYVRVVGGGALLPSPRARRSAASASLRPVGGVSGIAWSVPPGGGTEAPFAGTDASLTAAGPPPTA